MPKTVATKIKKNKNSSILEKKEKRLILYEKEQHWIKEQNYSSIENKIYL